MERNLRVCLVVPGVTMTTSVLLIVVNLVITIPTNSHALGVSLTPVG